jgi:hypothetical protein
MCESEMILRNSAGALFLGNPNNKCYAERFLYTRNRHAIIHCSFKLARFQNYKYWTNKQRKGRVHYSCLLHTYAKYTLKENLTHITI